MDVRKQRAPMPHEKKPKCPNPYTVYRSLKKQGSVTEKYDEWKARLMVIAGMKKSNFKRLLGKITLPEKPLKETYARKLRSIAKDIRKDMRHRFKVDRETARNAVSDLIETLANDYDKDDSTVVSNATSAWSTIQVGEGAIKYVPNPKSIYDALKKEEEVEVLPKYDQWKAQYIVQAGGPKKTRAFRAIMAGLANRLNDGHGLSIIRSTYVTKLRRAMREIAKDIVSCKSVSRNEAKEKVKNLLLSMAQLQKDDISTIVSRANGSPAAPAATATIRRTGRIPPALNIGSPSGDSVITNGTGLETVNTQQSVFSRVAGAVGGAFQKANQGLGDFANRYGAVDDDDEDLKSPMVASYRHSYFNDDGSSPSFYRRSQWRGIAPRRW